MTEENSNTIIIFLKDGKNLQFEKVEQFRDDEEGWIGFVYQDISTGENRIAVFYLNSIVGYDVDSKLVRED